MCPQFQVPVGSGFILYGVNQNIISNNAIYDNWRSGRAAVLGAGRGAR